MKKSFFKDMKIGNKLIMSYLLACLIPLLVSSFIIYKVAAKNLEEASLEFASIFSSQIVTNIDDFIEEYDKVTKSILVDNDVIYQLNDNANSTIIEKVNRELVMRKIMLRLQTLKPEIVNIIFLTNQGELYQYNTEGAFVDVESLKDQEWMGRIKESEDNLTITSMHDRSYYDRNSDGIVLTVGRQVFNNGGGYEGILLIDIEPSSLIKLSDAFLLARNNYNIKISITDAYEDILYDSDVASGRITWREVQSLNSPFVLQKTPNEFLLLTNETKRAGLKINVIIPRSELLFKINKISYVAIFNLLVFTVIAVVTSSLFSRTITKPIRMIQKRMKQAEDGNYKVLEQKESNDEVGNLISSYNDMVTKIKTLIEDVYIAEIKHKNAKYLALQTQINPHMLYNTLDSIRMKALMNGDEEVAEMIKILAKMFRKVLNKSTTNNLIKDEVDYVENYVKMQNMRFKNTFSIKIDVEEEVLNSPIISMVLQPVIENSIEHGFKGHSCPLYIVLKGTFTKEKNILLQICDNGKGMLRERIEEINRLINMVEPENFALDKDQEEGENSIGLKNIAERIKLHYGIGYYLKIAGSTEKGTVIEILIPGK